MTITRADIAPETLQVYKQLKEGFKQVNLNDIDPNAQQLKRNTEAASEINAIGGMCVANTAYALDKSQGNHFIQHRRPGYSNDVLSAAQDLKEKKDPKEQYVLINPNSIKDYTKIPDGALVANLGEATPDKPFDSDLGIKMTKSDGSSWLNNPNSTEKGAYQLDAKGGVYGEGRHSGILAYVPLSAVKKSTHSQPNQPSQKTITVPDTRIRKKSIWAETEQPFTISTKPTTPNTNQKSDGEAKTVTGKCVVV
jgi:hypothetical protein